MASKSLFGQSLNRSLPISNSEIQKLLTHLKAPSACAALYQQLISQGVEKSLDLWQKRDLNFQLHCLPPNAREALVVCESDPAGRTGITPACQKVMGYSRAFLILTLLEKDDRPLVAPLKAAHQLYVLQDQVEKQPELVVKQTEILLRDQPRELDAHLMRVLALKARGARGEEKKALDTSMRWLATSNEKRHQQLGLAAKTGSDVRRNQATR